MGKLPFKRLRRLVLWDFYIYTPGLTQPVERFQTCESHRKMKTTFAKTHARPPKPAIIMKTPMIPKPSEKP